MSSFKHHSALSIISLTCVALNAVHPCACTPFNMENAIEITTSTLPQSTTPATAPPPSTPKPHAQDEKRNQEGEAVGAALLLGILGGLLPTKLKSEFATISITGTEGVFAPGASGAPSRVASLPTISIYETLNLLVAPTTLQTLPRAGPSGVVPSLFVPSGVLQSRNVAPSRAFPTDVHVPNGFFPAGVTFVGGSSKTPSTLVTSPPTAVTIIPPAATVTKSVPV